MSSTIVQFVLRHSNDLFSESNDYIGVYVCNKNSQHIKLFSLECAETISCKKSGCNGQMRLYTVKLENAQKIPEIKELLNRIA